MSISAIRPHENTYSFPSRRTEYRSDNSNPSLEKDKTALSEASDKEKPDDQISAGQLTDSEKELVTRLKKRDAEVRRHEQSHIAGAGGYAKGGAHFDLQLGPDGVNYAIGGEVSLDVSKVPNNPEATIRKMEAIRRAALAPANPSSKDQSVARNAAKAIQSARNEIRTNSQQSSESGGYNPYSLKTTTNIANPTISFMA